MTPSLLVADQDLTHSEWLRRFALTRMKYSAPDRDRLLEIANLMQETERVRDLLAQQLDRIANTIKGPPEPDSAWGFEDLPELVRALMIEAGRPVLAVGVH